MTKAPLLLFDLDGTLVDSALAIATALSTMTVERGGGAVLADQVRGLVSGGAQALVATCLGDLGGDPSADLLEFRKILSGLPADPAMIYPGVVQALEVIASTGAGCAVVTNKPEGLALRLLEDLDLLKFFSVVIGGDTLDVAKPHAAPLRHALAELGADERASAVMIGDSHVDAGAALQAGLPFLLYEGGYGADSFVVGEGGLPCDGRFSDFSALPAMLALPCLG